LSGVLGFADREEMKDTKPTKENFLIK